MISSITFLAILQLLVLPQSHALCPPGARSTRTYRGVCYDEIYIQKTWSQAKSYCESEPNGQLLQMNSYSLRSNLRYWIDGYAWTAGFTDSPLVTTTTAGTTRIPTTTLPSTTTPQDVSNANSTSNSNSTAAPTSLELTTTTTADIRTTPTTTSFPSTTPVPRRWYYSGKDSNANISSFHLWWSSGQPASATGDCIAVTSSGYYAAQNCSRLNYFICEYKCRYSISTPNVTTISSPNYPLNYASGTECEWFIDVGEGQAILEFNDFKTEGCCCDYLQVRETQNSPELLVTLCGSTKPQTITSPTRYLYLRFRTDSSVTYRGFQATVRSSTVPLTIHMQASHGVVTTPDFPLSYANNLTISWLLEVPRGGINLQFTEIDIQPGSNSSVCDRDSLVIREGSKNGRVVPNGIICGTQIPNVTKSYFNTRLHLTFTADDTVQKSGFRAIFWSSYETCVNILSGGGGTITSPGFPLRYPPNLQCVWYIDVLNGTAKINFTDFEVDYSFNCGQDVLEIWDGRLSNGSRLGSSKYCGSIKPSRLTSGSRYMTLFFRTNGYESDNGFRADFRSSLNCSGTYEANNGTIASPNYPSFYDPYANCTWLINVLDGNATLEFNVFSIQFHEQCLRDKVEIYDGNSTDAKLIGTYCGTKSPGVVKGSSQYLLVRMTSDGTYRDLGFSADFWSSDMPCPNFRKFQGYTVYNGQCYGFLHREYSWTSARNYCERQNSSLLFIESREEYNVLKKWVYTDLAALTSVYDVIWTGGYKRSTGLWFWSRHTGDGPFNESISRDHLWAFGEPGSSDLYVQMTNNGLSAVSYSFSDAYMICKKPVPSSSSSSIVKPSTPAPGTAYCSPPPNIRHGYYDPAKAFYSNGSEVTFKCESDFDVEYELKGASKIICNNGVWNGKSPTCDKITLKGGCVPPPRITFGSFHPDRRDYVNGSTVQYKCIPGFKLSILDHNQLDCLEGRWQGYTPQCKNAGIKPPATAAIKSNNKDKEYTTLLAATVTIISVLVIVLVAVGVVFIIKYRAKIARDRLIEMH